METPPFFRPYRRDVAPEPGERGRKGITLLHLRDVSEASAKRVLIAAWQNALTPQHPVAKTG